MNNKTEGTKFEIELCEHLASEGFWAHNIAAKSAGQPADVIAVKNGIPVLIDCKVCENDCFNLTRIEPNQEAAMTLWYECGNSHAYFAVKLKDGLVFMITYTTLAKLWLNNVRVLKRKDIVEYGMLIEEWVGGSK